MIIPLSRFWIHFLFFWSVSHISTLSIFAALPETSTSGLLDSAATIDRATAKIFKFILSIFICCLFCQIGAFKQDRNGIKLIGTGQVKSSPPCQRKIFCKFHHLKSLQVTEPNTETERSTKVIDQIFIQIVSIPVSSIY